MKWITLIICIVAMSCTNKKKADTKSDTFRQNNEKVLAYVDSNVIIYTQDSLAEETITEVQIKFEPYIVFNDFPVELYKGVKKELQLTAKDKYWLFRTRIRQGYKDSVNFAGYYRLIMWGCGSDCQLAVVVDARSGKIYEAPDASHGYDFRPDSRLLIVNPPSDEEGWAKAGYYHANCIHCKPSVYIWDEKNKKFIQRFAGYK